MRANDLSNAKQPHRSEENHFKSFITLFCTSVSNQSLSKKNWTTVLFLCATRWRRKGQKENIGWMKVNNRGCIWVEENDWRSLTRMRERERKCVCACVVVCSWLRENEELKHGPTPASFWFIWLSLLSLPARNMIESREPEFDSRNRL